MFRSLWRASLAVATACIGTTALAVTAFSDLGPGDTFDTLVGYTTTGPQNALGQVAAASQFTSEATGVLDRIFIPIGQISGLGTIQVTLFADSANSVGAPITDWSFSSALLPTFGDAYAPQVLVNAFPSIVLTTGTKYWVSVWASDGDIWSAWNQSNTSNASGLVASLTGISGGFPTFGAPTVDTRGGMRVDVLSSEGVPGPGAILPFAIGVLSALRRRRAT